MIILDYSKKQHKEIIRATVLALKQGKIVAYPTDTSYGLAADAENSKAIKRLYKIKDRIASQPIHVIIPSLAAGKQIAHWDRRSLKLAKSFWPGPLTLVLWLKSKKAGYKMLSGGSGTIGMRVPNNAIALDLAKSLGRAITTTSANPSSQNGGVDSYSAKEVVKQFSDKAYRPDIVINAGKLPLRKPSTVVRVLHEPYEILREGPISEKQISRALKHKP